MILGEELKGRKVFLACDKGKQYVLDRIRIRMRAVNELLVANTSILSHAFNKCISHSNSLTALIRIRSSTAYLYHKQGILSSPSSSPSIIVFVAASSTISSLMKACDGKLEASSFNASSLCINDAMVNKKCMYNQRNEVSRRMEPQSRNRSKSHSK